MALANVAANLASKGRRVVMIDFDLEAPGLDSFDAFNGRGAAGVVEYVDEFLRTKVTPPIENFVLRCPVSDDLDGELWLMPSGRKDAAYAKKLHQTNWNALYTRGVAQPFIANWKNAIERTFQPDYVLIDSRTGLTDIGGVCTLHFPDIVVLLFALNKQNIDGTAGVLKAITRVEQREPIQTVLVASPIPNIGRDESSPLAKRMAEAQQAFGNPINAVVGYFPSVVLEERLWTLDTSFPTPRIAEDYRALTEQILRRLHDGFDFLIKRAEAVLNISDESAVQPLIDALSGGYSARAETHHVIARLERLRGRRDASLSALERALLIDPADNVAFTFVATQYRVMDRMADLHHLVDGIALRISEARSARYYDTWFSIGQHYMMFAEPKKAMKAYENALACEDAGKPLLSTWFNLAEARRRTTSTVSPLDWMTVLGELEKNPIDSTSTTDLNVAALIANRFQAMHVAYALTGNVTKAAECLDRALSIASTLNQTALLFSLATYTMVSTNEFIASTVAMKAALTQGRLWDGMQLAAEKR